MAFGLLLEGQRLGELDHLARGEVELGGRARRVDVDLHLVELAAAPPRTARASAPGRRA